MSHVAPTEDVCWCLVYIKNLKQSIKRGHQNRKSQPLDDPGPPASRTKVRQSALQNGPMIFLLAFHKRSTATYQRNHALGKEKCPNLFRNPKSNSWTNPWESRQHHCDICARMRDYSSQIIYEVSAQVHLSESGSTLPFYGCFSRWMHSWKGQSRRTTSWQHPTWMVGQVEQWVVLDQGRSSPSNQKLHSRGKLPKNQKQQGLEFLADTHLIQLFGWCRTYKCT